ncbi:MAG: cellulase family glycosylhydrolase [Sandaracinaceae bacterium]|nr:cellulase family glycosylhydrolase [Sandaracinaceae bacterium]
MTRLVAALLVVLAGCDEAGPAGSDAGPGEACLDRWSLSLPDAVVEDLASSDVGLFAFGRAGDDGWIGTIDACRGQLAREERARPEGADRASLTAGAVRNGERFAVGATSDDGVLVRGALDGPLAYVAALGDPGSVEAFADVAAAGDALYLAGDVSSAGPSRALLVRVDGAGEACPLTAPEGRRARALATDGDRVYLAVSSADSIALHRYSESTCARAGCACSPAASGPAIPIGPGEPTVTALAIDGGRAWLGGYLIEGPGRGAAFLVRVDLDTGVVEATSRLDPTDGVDGFVDLALDGDLVLATGATGWDGGAGFASATGVLAAFDRDFVEGASPIVILEPSGVRLVNAVGVDTARSGFWLAGLTGDGSSRVQRCLRSADGCEGTLTGEWPDAPPPSMDGGATGLDGGTPPEDAGVSGPSPPAIDPRDGRRFVRDGRPWYPTGYYPGAGLNMTGPDYAGDYRAYDDALVDRLAAEGIDLFRVWINWGALPHATPGMPATWDAFVLTPYARTGPGVAIDGLPRLDLDAWNEAYFDELEHTVARAEAAGIVVQLLLLDCWHAGFGRSFGFEDFDFFAAQNNANGVSFASEAAWADVDGPIYARNVAFVEEVVRRVGHHPNVVWETCNEPRWVPPSDPAAVAAHPFHARLAARIHAVEADAGHPTHLVMPVDLPEHRTVAGHRTPADSAAQSVDDFRRALVSTQHAWGIPLVSDNDCCPGEPDAALLRRKAWAAFTGGAHLDVFNNEMFQRSVLESTNTTLGMRWVSIPGRLVRDRGIDLATMAPCDATVAPARWCYGHATGERILYVEGGGDTTVSDAPAPADAVWLDPRTGALSDAGDGPTFTAPSASDWVLHVR